MNRNVATKIAVTVVLIASTCSGQLPTANSNLKLFMPVMGEWVAEVTLQNDVPGFGKKGDNVPVMAKKEPGLDIGCQGLRRQLARHGDSEVTRVSLEAMPVGKVIVLPHAGPACLRNQGYGS